LEVDFDAGAANATPAAMTKIPATAINLFMG
jgi:hypothetical protein